MILAAGRGERMQHLTENTPKALLRVADHYLIEYPIFSLRKMGVKEIVINVCYFADKIKEVLGDGSRYGVRIIYSDEEIALETGGGIFQALPFLGSDPFIVLSCDVLTDYPLKQLPTLSNQLAHLILVDNPIYHPKGDFGLEKNKIIFHEKNTLTFGNIGIYRPELFAGCQPGKFRLGDLLRAAIQQNAITGEHYTGFWKNLGTPDDLETLHVVPDSLLLDPI